MREYFVIGDPQCIYIYIYIIPITTKYKYIWIYIQQPKQQPKEAKESRLFLFSLVLDYVHVVGWLGILLY